MTVGDFNCHILELDGRESKAVELGRLVKKYSLTIVNLEPQCEGKTWSCNNQNSTIDYILINDKAGKENIKIDTMHIDESKVTSCASNHNRILLKLNTNNQRQKKEAKTTIQENHWKLGAEDKIQKFASELEKKNYKRKHI